MKMSWQQRLKEEVEFWKRECYARDRRIDVLEARLQVIEPYVKAPPTIMIACERLVEAAAKMCHDALETRRCR